MSRFEVHPSALRSSAGVLSETAGELQGLRAELGQLEQAAGAAWSGPVMAAIGSVEHRWAAAVGAMELGATKAGAAVGASAVAYEHVDRHVMPQTRAGG